MREIWKPISGYEGMYEVSNLGNVRSYHRHSCPTGRPDEPHPVYQFETTGGYLLTTLSKKGKQWRQLTHRLVAQEFLAAPTFDGATVNHKDLNKKNNRVDNLEWMTRGDNCRHALGSYEHPKGEDWHASKLSEKDVVEMRAKRAAGAKLKDLAREYAIAISTTQQIVERKRWKHVQ